MIRFENVTMIYDGSRAGPRGLRRFGRPQAADAARAAAEAAARSEAEGIDLDTGVADQTRALPLSRRAARQAEVHPRAAARTAPPAPRPDGATHPALDNVSLEVAKGEFVFLVGSSGSGKSTFLRLVLREERATSGLVHVAGKDVARLAAWKVPQLRRQIGVVFQDFRLLPNKTVFENVAFALQVIGKPRHAIAHTVPEVLDLVGLGGKEQRFPHELSGGEQQRVAIARAFVNRPSILLADEPTGNLDPTTSVGIMRLLDRINRTGTTIVMATHDDEIVDQMRKRVCELEDGRLVRDQDRGVYGSTR